jgi:hypothetical protein
VAQVSTKTKAYDSIPYLDADKLLKECLQIVRKHFRLLQYGPWYRLPHSKAIVSQSNYERFEIYFPESRTWLSPAATPEAFTSAILHYYGRGSIRVALWNQLPATKFFEVLLHVQRSGVTLICCHAQHAVLQFDAREKSGSNLLMQGAIAPDLKTN